MNGVYEFGYSEGHRGSIAEVAGKVGILTDSPVELVMVHVVGFVKA